MLQVGQSKLKVNKLFISAEPLQGIRNQIIPYRGREDYRRQGRDRSGNFRFNNNEY